MPPKNWLDAQNHIHALYIVQHQTLRRVKELMLLNYGFNASIRAYRDKLKEWGYLRREVRQQDSLPTPGGDDGRQNAALPMAHLAPGIYESLPDFNVFSNSVPLASEGQELWQNTSLHGDISSSQVGQRNTSYMAMPNSDASVYSLLPGSSSGSRLNTRDSSGKTLLHQAVISRSPKDVEKYLSMGLAVNAQDDDNNQPLHHAANRGFQEIVHLLLKHRADPNAKGKSGRTPLHMSVRFRKTMKEILNAYPAVSSQDDNGDTPLHLALSSSTLEERPKGSVIEQLILSGANVNALNSAQITPFHMVLENIDSRGKYYTNFVVMFLENNVDISLQTKDGRFPFEVFMEKIGPRWYSRYYSTPSAKRNPDLKMFIAMKANIDITLESGRTLLNEALHREILYPSRDFELGRLLCDTADVKRSDSAGDYPLHIIAKKACAKCDGSSLEWAKVFFQRGANPNTANQAGESPLVALLLEDWMTESTLSFVSLLLESGANPMMRDLKGNLPIYYVARSNRGQAKVQVLELLLENSPRQGTINQLHASEDSAPKDQEWWEGYHRFFQQQAWSDPGHLSETTHLMPNDVAELISSTALKLVATKFLRLAKSDFDSLKATRGLQHQDTQAQGYQMVAILRDCHVLKIEVDQSWYHYLLDLFD